MSFSFRDNASVAVIVSLFDGSVQADWASEILRVWLAIMEYVELVGA